MTTQDRNMPREVERKSFNLKLVGILMQTKLFWGLAALYLVGVLSSPLTSAGRNIFVSYGNTTDVLRQVSVTGIVAIGMTLVILIAGIDLSVGSLLALGSVTCAMLLTKGGWTAATYFGIPAAGLVVLLSSLFAMNFIGKAAGLIGKRNDNASARSTDVAIRSVLMLAAAGTALLAMMWAAAQVDTKFGVLAVLLVVPCIGAVIGALNGTLIVVGKLQPFIVTLAMMVGVLGLARVIAGQDTAVYPVYTGTNATINFENLRILLWGIIPVPVLFFLGALIVFQFVTRMTTFGGYLRAIGGNEEASRLAGINVGRIKIITYAISGYLAALASVLYVAQFRQGKPDAGVGLELDAIAAVVIGGTSLMGGKGSVIGTLVGVLIFGFLGNILQLNNIDSNTQLILKGVIIILAVVVQEGQLRSFFSRLKFIGDLGKRRP